MWPGLLRWANVSFYIGWAAETIIRKWWPARFKFRNSVEFAILTIRNTCLSDKSTCERHVFGSGGHRFVLGTIDLRQRTASQLMHKLTSGPIHAVAVKEAKRGDQILEELIEHDANTASVLNRDNKLVGEIYRRDLLAVLFRTTPIGARSRRLKGTATDSSTGSESPPPNAGGGAGSVNQPTSGASSGQPATSSESPETQRGGSSGVGGGAPTYTTSRGKRFLDSTELARSLSVMYDDDEDAAEEYSDTAGTSHQDIPWHGDMRSSGGNLGTIDENHLSSLENPASYEDDRLSDDACPPPPCSYNDVVNNSAPGIVVINESRTADFVKDQQHSIGKNYYQNGPSSDLSELDQYAEQLSDVVLTKALAEVYYPEVADDDPGIGGFVNPAFGTDSSTTSPFSTANRTVVFADLNAAERSLPDVLSENFQSPVVNMVRPPIKTPLSTKSSSDLLSTTTGASFDSPSRGGGLALDLVSCASGASFGHESMVAHADSTEFNIGPRKNGTTRITTAIGATMANVDPRVETDFTDEDDLGKLICMDQVEIPDEVRKHDHERVFARTYTGAAASSANGSRTATASNQQLDESSRRTSGTTGGNATSTTNTNAMASSTIEGADLL